MRYLPRVPWAFRLQLNILNITSTYKTDITSQIHRPLIFGKITQTFKYLQYQLLHVIFHFEIYYKILMLHNPQYCAVTRTFDGIHLNLSRRRFYLLKNNTASLKKHSLFCNLSPKFPIQTIQNLNKCPVLNFSYLLKTLLM